MSPDLFGHDRVEDAIALLKLHEPPQGYYGCFSGGKDSCVIKELARLAGVKVTWHYNVTTIDPPELVAFIKREHPGVAFDYPSRGGFFAQMTTNGFPTRRARWCCKEFKEKQPPLGSRLILGVRAVESPRRAATWQPVTFHRRARAWALAPVLRWADADVWAFIRERRIPYSPLYDEGFDRLGCIGCPMASRGRVRQFARWPKFEAAWQSAFRRIWEKRSGTPQRNGETWFGDRHFRSWREMWAWWMSDGAAPELGTALFDDEADSCQIALDMLSQPDESEAA